jgi:hypothetical protein
MIPLKHKTFAGILLSAFLFSFIPSALSDSSSNSKDKQDLSQHYIPPGPGTTLSSLDPYKISPDENPLSAALKAQDMMDSLTYPLVNLDTQHSITANGLPRDYMDKVDEMSSEVKQMYNGIRNASSQVDSMKGQLKSNYEQFNGSPQTSQESEGLNSQSDAMAGKAGAMKATVQRMEQKVRDGSSAIDQMNSDLDQMAQNGQQTEKYYDQLTNHIKDASRQFEGMARTIKDQGLDAPEAFDQARKYFSDLQSYVEAHKPFTNQEINYVKNVKNYLRNNQEYLNKAGEDFGKIEKNLGDNEEYFHNAKVKPSAGAGSPLELQPPESSSGGCSSLTADEPDGGKGKGKGKPLMDQQTCQKTCRTVCKQEKKSGGSWCFSCPSGSPDTCYSHGGFPADVSWCKPGGICAQDPELYCQGFGAIGSNGEHLNCTNCKQAADDCWEKVPGTTNLTHCVQWCNDGICTYKGKYKLSDTPVKFMHCYECKKIPPPTCESLGWGSSTLNMCLKNCVGGECNAVKITVGQDGKPRAQDPNAPLNPGGPGGQNGENGGQCGGAGCGNGQNNGNPPNVTGQGGGTNNGGDQGNQPNPPPTDNPLGGDNSGGGGSVAGGGGKPKGEPGKTTEPSKTGEPGKTTGEPQKPPAKDPGNPKPNEPQAPNTQDKPKLPANPTTTPPDKWKVDFYNNLINGSKERIKTLKGYIQPGDGEGLKTMVRQDIEGEQKQIEEWEKKRDKALEEYNTQQKDYEDTKKYFENYYKTLPKKPSYAEEAKKRGEAYNLGKLKEANENLKTIVKEAKDSFDNRKKRIDDIDKEISRLKNENDNLSDTVTRGREGSEEAKKRTDDNNKRIEQLTKERIYYLNGLKKSQERYKEQIEKAKTEVRTALFRTDENARRKVEVVRIDEYYDMTMELKRRKLVQAERNKVFDSTKQSLENARQDAIKRGDTKEADKLKDQEDGIQRTQDKWNQMQDEQQAMLNNQIYETEKRNFDEWAGPTSEKSLTEQLNKYKNILNDKLKDTTLTADQKNGIQATIDGINDKLNNLANPQLGTQDIQTVDQTALRVANGAMDEGPEKSFTQLAFESIGEEALHNMNPFVAAKKSLAFGWGMVKGVGAAVKGLAELGYNVTVGTTTLLVQAAAMDVGLDGVFGTSALDSFNDVLTTGYNNANVDGLLKATMAAGAALDAKITELEKSKDIDWATAETGGHIVGENVVGPELAGAALGKVFTTAKAFIKGEEVATDVANATTKVEEAANAANKTEEAANAATKTEEAANTATKTEEAANAGKSTEKAVEEAGGTRPSENPEGKTPGTESKTPGENPAEEGTKSRGPPENAPPPEGKTPPVAPEFDNTKPLPDTGKTQVKRLDDSTLEKLEKKNGFRKDHAERMNEFAQKKDVYLIVRDGNPDSVPYFGNDEMMAKPMTSKAKTAKVGPDIGLVVDPTHPQQAGYWDQAITDAKSAGDMEKVDKLTKARNKALDAWQKYGDDMLHHGYQVNPKTGVIEYVETLPDGSTKVWKGVHGDYDLHGVYKANADGTIEHVSYGSGNNLDVNHVDTEGTALRSQLNDAITKGEKDFIQHGAQDDWIPDPNKVGNKVPDPPATVFFPDGRPPVTLNNAQEMKDFYEKVMGVKFPYSDEAVAASMKATAKAAAE